MFLPEHGFKSVGKKMSFTAPSVLLMMAGVRSDVLSDSSSRQIGVRTVTTRTPTSRQQEHSNENLGVHLVVKRPSLTTGLKR